MDGAVAWILMVSAMAGGVDIPASSYRKGAPCYLEKLFLSEDSIKIQAYFNCSRATTVVECSSPEPLGLEDGTITDDHITSSRSHSRWPAKEGRLNYHGGWKAYGSTDPWIEVDFVETTPVAGAITQGGGEKYVTLYKVAYKKQPSSDYKHVTDGSGNITVFTGNTDVDTPVTNLFEESVLAKVVRIEPTAWHVGAALRLELLGCRRD
ncbi:lactadherin-like [Patiria miniata]|uniref:F5/8 type C domain-containing protein n=1 Tax=Patiria miniata TaxID=46514 RepID=A0A914A987_PATMI|nr:lactadherin-like [Patiria miniata]